MATYVSMGRTNYFAVRDVQALQNLVDGTGIELSPPEGGNVVVLLDAEGTDWMIYPEDDGDEIYLPDVIHEHLQPGEICIFQSIGNEKCRFIAGHSVAVNSDGDQVWVRLSDIYEAAAAKFGINLSNISVAEY